MYKAFIEYQKNLENNKDNKDKHAGIIRDYFLSHPPLPLREEEYSEKARAWWKSNHENRYVGKKNLRTRDAGELKEEWISGL